jgi:LPS export ABC transporter protein LptC
MTFVGSRGSAREVLLRSRTASFRPAQRIAELHDVNAQVNEDEEGRSFSMTCERAELNIDTNDFSAEGNVQGETGEGQRYWAPWVRYNHEEGILFTDAPVRMVDSTGSFRGDGFRYHLRERRFQLLGHVRVEQLP